ncbi:Lrp/AsnC family transcriptional regulator [Candidatus Woesearchaeota archaeon]|nr:Lrp/AsnC family transcriptional regulator [Candidatus Woesearchaeota archaeon]
MNNVDTVLVALLRGDSRMSLTDMSRMTKIPVSTIYEKLKHYRKGLIRKHTSLVDFAQLGFHIRARVLLKAKKTELQKLREHLFAHPSLNELYKVNNGYDFMADFIFQTMKELEDYLDMLEEKYGVEKEQVFYMVDELKREEFLSKAGVLLLGKRK